MANNGVNIAVNLVRTMRPQQWIKSAFLFAPALFTLDILKSAFWGKLLVGVAGFSLVASAVYSFNDILNRREDRLHPIKCKRPVASGAISAGGASGLSVVCLTIGLVLLNLAAPRAAFIGAGYAVLMVAYTLILRRLLIVDVIVIATGFVLRVEAGGAIISEPLSHWLVLCTFTIALFLGMIKRREEIVAFAGVNSPVRRAVLGEYPDLPIVDGWINVTAGMTILCYSLYTVDPITTAKHGTGTLIYTVPFVLYGIFRYQKIAMGDRRGEDPTGIVLTDFGIQTAVVLWAITVGLLLFFKP